MKSVNEKEAKDNFWRKIAEIFFKLVSSTPHSTGKEDKSVGQDWFLCRD